MLTYFKIKTFIKKEKQAYEKNTFLDLISHLYKICMLNIACQSLRIPIPCTLKNVLKTKNNV